MSPTRESARETAQFSLDRLVTGIRRKDPNSDAVREATNLNQQFLQLGSLDENAFELQLDGRVDLNEEEEFSPDNEHLVNQLCPRAF